jgi:hypothetical protein
MDKILLTAFLTALAGFITAVLSIVKLVNEKESKTSEYRQAWTESLRPALAELIGNVSALASLVASNKALMEHFLKLMGETSNDERIQKANSEAIAVYRGQWDEGLKKQRDLTRSLYEGYAKVRLHFKPDDLSFSRFENKFETILSVLEVLKKSDVEKDIAESKEKIHALSSELTAIARNIMKAEWETVKLGEPAYKKTKTLSVRFSIVMLFVLFVIGAHAVISFYKSH